MSRNSFSSPRWADSVGGIIVVLLGVLALVAPEFLLGSVSLAVGIGILIFGAVQILRSWQRQKAGAYMPMGTLLVGIFAVVIGLVFLIHRATPIAIFSTCFGIWAVGSGAVKMNNAIGCRQAGLPCAWLFIQSFINIAFGFFLIVNPVGVSVLWVRLVGAYLVYLGVVFLIAQVTEKRT